MNEEENRKESYAQYKKKYKQSLYQANREKWAKIENGYKKKRMGLPLEEDEKDDYTNSMLSFLGFVDE